MNKGTDNKTRERHSGEAPPDYGRKQFEQETGALHADEEYAAELTPGVIPFPRREDEKLRTETERTMSSDVDAIVNDEPAAEVQSRAIGIAGLVLAAISLFLLPAVLGPASVVVGFAAYVRGSRTLGIWTMALGLLAVAAYYVLVPYYT